MQRQALVRAQRDKDRPVTLFKESVDRDVAPQFRVALERDVLVQQGVDFLLE